MFDNPDALASRMSKREALHLVVMHAALSHFAPSGDSEIADLVSLVEAVVDHACKVPDTDEIEAAPAPKEDPPVVGQFKADDPADPFSDAPDLLGEGGDRT